MKTGVFISKFNDHRLVTIERKGNQSTLFVRVFCVIDIGKTRAILHRSLWKNNKIPANFKPGLILRVVNTSVHLRGNLPTGKRSLQDLS